MGAQLLGAHAGLLPGGSRDVPGPHRAGTRRVDRVRRFEERARRGCERHGVLLREGGVLAPRALPGRRRRPPRDPRQHRQPRRRHPGLGDLVVGLEGGTCEYLRRRGGRATGLLPGPHEARRGGASRGRRRGDRVLCRSQVGQVDRQCCQRGRRRDRRVSPVVRRRRTIRRLVNQTRTRKEPSMHKHRWAIVVVAVLVAGVAVTAAFAAKSRSTAGKTFHFIPKDTLNPYEVIADRGGKIALTRLGNKQVVSSGTEDTAAAQQPAIQAAIQAHAAGIVIAGNDPKAVCPALQQAQAQGTKVIAFDSDVNCRQHFINQADTETIGRNQIKLLGRLMHYKGQFAILSAASTATNQNAWIRYMKLELKKPKYKGMKLVKTYYGNDNPAQSRQATVSMLQAYPHLKGIESPTTVGISSAAQYLSTSKYKKKVVLTGLGLPSQMKKYVHNGTVTAFALWNPEDLGYLAGYAVSALAEGKITGTVGETFTAGKLGKYTIVKGPDGRPQVILGPPYVFTLANVDKFKF